MAGSQLLGEPKRLHPDTELVSSFEEAKIFVEADLSKELPRTYFFQVRGEEVRVDFEYPWLPQKCGICKKWGHSDDGCLANPNQVGSLVTISDSQLHVAPVSNSSTEAEISNAVVELRLSPKRVSKQTGKDENIIAKDLVVVETEPPVSPVLKQSERTHDGDWQNVPNSGGKHSKGSAQNLVYGQVRIISPTSFDVLRDTQEEGEIIPETELGEKSETIPVVDKKEAANAESGGKSETTPAVDKKEAALATQQKTQSIKEAVASRVQLPRDSKNSHKFISENSQRAKDNVQNTFRRKNSKSKH